MCKYLFNISINQRAVVENGFVGKLDLVDLVIFDFIYHFLNITADKRKIIIENGVEYTEIKLELITAQMPLINIGTKRTFINRMNNLVSAELIERYPDNQRQGISYYKKGKKFSVLHFCEEPMKQEVDPMKQNALGVKEISQQNGVGGVKQDSHNNNYNNYTNNTSNKNNFKKDNTNVLSKSESFEDSELEVERETELKPQEETTPLVAGVPPTEDLSFDRFWNIYDKKVGKAKAISQFGKLKLSDLTKLFEVLDSYIESKPDKQYRPDPERYLRNRVWEDEIILPNIKPQSNGGISTTSSSEVISTPQGYVYDPTSHF